MQTERKTKAMSIHNETIYLKAKKFSVKTYKRNVLVLAVIELVLFIAAGMDCVLDLC